MEYNKEDIFGKEDEFYYECPDCAFYTTTKPIKEKDSTEHDCEKFKWQT